MNIKILLLALGSFLVVFSVFVIQEHRVESLQNAEEGDGASLLIVPRYEETSTTTTPDTSLEDPERVPVRILIGTTTSATPSGTGTLTLNVETKFVKKEDISKPSEEEKVKASAQNPAPEARPVVKPVTNPTPVPAKKPLTWGVFTGSNQSAIADFESRVDENPDYLAYFIHWPNDNGQLRPWLKTVAGDKDRTLVIFWEASDHTVGGTDQPAFSYRKILAGDHDAYIKDFARQLKTYGDPIILVPFSELNGNWTPWSGTKNGNTPEEAVAAYRYVHDFFNDVPNVKFGLALNAASVPNTPENAHTAYYPGDEYVDYIGLDGFNMNWPWESFSTLFGPGLNTISQYGKPMFIFSFASAEGEEKAEWLQDAFTQMEKYPLMKGFIYFNQNKERNWLLWSDPDTFKVFTAYIGSL